MSDLHMEKTAQAILERINEAHQQAERLHELVTSVNIMRSMGNGRFYYEDEDGNTLGDFQTDTNGRLKELIIEELVRQIEEEYETLKRLGFNPE
jgi:hypothetical protein